MPGPLESAGVARNPTKYAALGMGGREFTGLITQAGPYSDPAVPYLVKKFYVGSRFDRIIDGINREIDVELTDVRSPGSKIWNSNNFPAINSFVSWSYTQNGNQIVRTIVDGADNGIYEATANAKTLITTRFGGSTPARFLPVATQLFYGDGKSQNKLIASQLVWQPATAYATGNFIIDPNGNIQEVCYVATNSKTRVPISSVAVPGTTTQTIFGINQPSPFVQGTAITASGLTTRTDLNGVTFPGAAPTLVNNVAGAGPSNTPYGPAPDTGYLDGYIFTGNGTETSGATQPNWGVSWGDLTIDGYLVWRCLYVPLQSWGIDMPSTANTSARIGHGNNPPNLVTRTTTPTVTPLNNNLFWWLASSIFAKWQAVLDSTGRYQIWQGNGTSHTTGPVQPTWNTALGGVTTDGAATWLNVGQASPWVPSFQYGLTIVAIIDPNGNLQITQNYYTTQTVWVTGVANTTGQGNTTGSTQPTWATALGATTTDGAYTWTCCGPGTVLRIGSVQYAYCYRAVDGSISNASQVNTTIVNGVLGLPGTYAVKIAGFNSYDDQCDQIWIERTANGQPTLLYLDAILNPAPANGTVQWTYIDVLPDTSLVAQLPAPINQQANSPIQGLKPLAFAYQRIWAAYQNLLYYSAGPDAVAIGGNGRTAFPPLNVIPMTGTVYAVVPITIQNGALLVYTSAGIQIVFGTGTAANPFYATNYYGLVNVSGFNAVSQLVGTKMFVFESNGKVSAISVQYPFDPSTGYTEVGLPIGDQFRKVTTGGVNAQLFNPATAYMTWNNQSTDENALYVADGATGWFRLSAISPPESGFMWAPLRQIVGGTSAVQSVVTAPGTTQLLIGPPATGGPILCRDDSKTVYTDNGNPYPSWDAKGITLLCSTGQWAEIAHIATKSANVGARPTISVVLGEIAPTTARPYKPLKVTGPDPADTPPSVTVFSDRYDFSQNGLPNTGDCLLTKFDYGTQSVGDKLLDWAIFSSLHDEREEAAQK